MELGKITQNSKQRSLCLCLAARSPQSFYTLYKMASIILDRSIEVKLLWFYDKLLSRVFNQADNEINWPDDWSWRPPPLDRSLSKHISIIIITQAGPQDTRIENLLPFSAQSADFTHEPTLCSYSCTYRALVTRRRRLSFCVSSHSKKNRTTSSSAHAKTRIRVKGASSYSITERNWKVKWKLTEW